MKVKRYLDENHTISDIMLVCHADSSAKGSELFFMFYQI